MKIAVDSFTHGYKHAIFIWWIMVIANMIYDLKIVEPCGYLLGFLCQLMNVQTGYIFKKNNGM